MGVLLEAYGIDEDLKRRVLAGDDADDFDELLEEMESESLVWIPIGEKGWDVMHWALTGERSAPGPTTPFFGARPIGPRISDWTGLLEPDEVRALAATLSGVDEATMRRRLDQVPRDVYWAEIYGLPEHHVDVIEDASGFAAFVTRCASGSRALLLALG